MDTFPTVWVVLLSSKYAPNFLASLCVHLLLLRPSTYIVPVELLFFLLLVAKFVTQSQVGIAAPSFTWRSTYATAETEGVDTAPMVVTLGKLTEIVFAFAFAFAFAAIENVPPWSLLWSLRVAIFVSIS